MKLFFKTFLFVLLIATACNEVEKKPTAANELTEIAFEKIKLADLNGQSIDLSQYKGKTVFINFWATWCKPCIGEMPSLERLTDKLKDENIVFLFASDETIEEIEEFKNAKSYSLDFVRAENLSDLNLMVLPTTFIFDKNTKLAFSEMGAREWDNEENVALITKIIKQ